MRKELIYAGLRDARRGALVFAILLTFTMLLGCKEDAATHLQEDKDEILETVSWVEVVERPMQGHLLLSGDIVANEQLISRVVTPISGKLSNISVEVGDKIERGTRLATIRSTEVSDYQKKLKSLESKVRTASRDLKMKEQLLMDGMVSEKEVSEAKEKLYIVQTSLNQQLNIGNINGFDTLSTAALIAPISGTILERQVYNNQYIEAGTEAFILSDLSQVWAVADVYESDISRISEGATVVVQTMAWPNERFEGRIDKIYGALDAESKTMKVRINLENPDLRLRPGMFASVAVTQNETEQEMLCVPAQSVIFENGHRYVVVKDEATCRRQEVKVAHEAEGWVYIKEGVSEGTMVANRNALLIFNKLGQ